MSTLTFKQKQRLARRNLTRDEIRNGTSIFDSEYWLKRKIKREDAAKKRDEARHVMAIRRKADIH